MSALAVLAGLAALGAMHFLFDPTSTFCGSVAAPAHDQWPSPHACQVERAGHAMWMFVLTFAAALLAAAAWFVNERAGRWYLWWLHRRYQQGSITLDEYHQERDKVIAFQRLVGRDDD